MAGRPRGRRLGLSYRVDDERREVRIISIVHGATDRANKID
jgi:hypothetical protein